jgi:hypothetical protein
LPAPSPADEHFRTKLYQIGRHTEEASGQGADQALGEAEEHRGDGHAEDAHDDDGPPPDVVYRA